MVLNKTLRILFLYNGIFVFAHGLIGPLYALYVESIGQKLFSVSLSWTVYLIATTICTFFVARYGDRVTNKGHLLSISFLLRAVAWIGLIFADSLMWLILIQILAGICEGLGVPAFNTIFAEHLDEGGHIRDYSDWTIISHIIIAASTLVAGIIVTKLGFQVLFTLMSFLAFVCFLGATINLKHYRSTK